jgi:hypothetical protein
VKQLLVLAQSINLAQAITACGSTLLPPAHQR